MRSYISTAAIVFFMCFICAHPGFGQNYLEQGENYYIKGDYKNALLMWHKAKDLNPEDLVVEKYIELARSKLMGKALDLEKEKVESLKSRKEQKRRPPFLVRFSEKIGFKDKKEGPSIEQIILKEKEILTLEDCIDIAIDNHIPLKVAKKQLKLAEIRLWEARRKLGPTLTLKWEETSGKIQGRHYEGKKLYFEGKQPVFYGGELFYNMQQATVNLEVVRNDYQRIKDEVILDVKKAYYNLDKAVKAILVQEKLHTNAKRLYDMVKKQFDEGIAPRVEYLNVSSQYNQTEFQYISSKEDIELAKLILQQAMNTEMGFEIKPVAEPTVVEIKLEDCYALAYTNHPKMKITMLMQDYYTYEKKIARAKGWPKFDFMGSYGRAYEEYIKKDSPDDPSRTMKPQWYVGGKVSMPVWGNTASYSITKEKWPAVVSAFKGTESLTHTTTLSFLDNLDYYAGKEESDIAFERAKEELSKTKQEISLEVKETFFKYKKALLQINVAKSKIDYQKTNVEILEERRKFGEAQASDVIEAMLKLAEEEFSYLQAVADYYIAVVSLNKAIGLEEYFQI